MPMLRSTLCLIGRARILPLALVLLARPLAAGEKDWPMWRCTVERSAVSTHELPATLRRQWVHRLPALTPCWEDPVNADRMPFDRVYEPIVIGSTLVFGSNRSDCVTALDTRTGRVKWKTYLDGPVRLPPAAWEGTVYVTSDDGRLYALDLADGRELWHVRGGADDRLLLGNGRLISAWPARGGVVVDRGVAYFTAGIWPAMGIFPRAFVARTGGPIWLNDGMSMPYLQHPHGARSFGGVAPQGSLALVGETLYLPGGRTLPARLARKTGELQTFAFGGKSEGTSRVCVAEDVYLCSRSLFTTAFEAENGRSIARWKEPNTVLDDGVLYLGGRMVRQVMLSERVQKETAGRGGRKRTTWSVPEGWTVEEDARGDLIRCGSRLYGGGGGRIFALTLAEKPELAWEASVDGTVARLVAGDDRLFVVTEEGGLYAFGGGAESGTVHKGKMVPLAPTAMEAQARAMLDRLPVKRGVCLAIGLESDELLTELVRISELSVVALDTDDERIARRRTLFDAAGLYGRRFSTRRGTIADLPPYLAVLAVCGDGAIRTPAQAARLYRSMRPYGGTAYLRGRAARGLRDGVDALDLPGLEFVDDEQALVLVRAGALPGSAPWTHENGDVANTVKSDDRLVKPPFGVLWFGGNSHVDVLPRHGHGPSPLVVGGRLFIEGLNCLSARDVYTGTVLWRREFDDLGTKGVYYNDSHRPDWRDLSYNQGHMPGANARGGNLVAVADALYLVKGSACLVLDPATGETRTTIHLPERADGRAADWGYVGVCDDVLLATAMQLSIPTGIDKRRGPSEAAPPVADPVAALLDYAGRDGPTSCSRALVAFDRQTGKVLWRREAALAFRHNAIAAGNKTVFCIDGLTRQQLAHLRFKGAILPETTTLYALDLKTGTVKWQNTEKAFGTWLGYSADHDLLVQGGRPSRDTVRDEEGSRAVAFRGTDGSVAWERETAYRGRPIIHNRTLFFEAGGFGALDLLTGETAMTVHPLTGDSVRLKYQRQYGCNTPVAGEHLLTFRSGAAGFFDLTQGGVANLAGFRSGCTNNLIPADGVLNAPDYTRTCTCNYQNQTSLAFVTMPEMNHWMAAPYDEGEAATIARVGINLGAPGDRAAPDGTLWLDVPSSGAASPKVPVTIDGMAPYRHDALLFRGEDAPAWVGASGLSGSGRVEIQPVIKPRAEKTPLRYTVILVFAEPESIAAGDRIFDVKLQGTTVLTGLDLAREAGPRACLQKQFEGVEIEDKLTIELVGTTGEPVLCGVKLVRE